MNKKPECLCWVYIVFVVTEIMFNSAIYNFFFKHDYFFLMLQQTIYFFILWHGYLSSETISITETHFIRLQSVQFLIDKTFTDWMYLA